MSAQGPSSRLTAPRQAEARPPAREPAAKQAPDDPPQCPPGWATGPPDFVGVGAQRAGTSRWYRLIVDHPQVQQAEKERTRHYFDRFQWTDRPELGAYDRFFPRPPGKLTGDWTPGYIAQYWTPHLLAEAAPEAKLLVSLRDPVERYLSALKLRLRARGAAGTAKRSDNPSTNSLAAIYRGLYAAQLAHLRRHFPRSQILLLQFERCVLDPEAELRRTYEFLGIDPDWLPSEAAADPADAGRGRETRPAAKVNEGRVSVQMPDADRRALTAFLERDVGALAQDHPEIDLALWPNFKHLLG